MTPLQVEIYHFIEANGPVEKREISVCGKELNGLRVPLSMLVKQGIVTETKRNGTIYLSTESGSGKSYHLGNKSGKGE